MEIAWIMALAVGVCNSGVALAAKAAEHRGCRPAPFSLISFAVAGVVAFGTTFGTATAWGDWRLWVFGTVMGALYLVAIATILCANRSWPPSLVWSTANMSFVLPVMLSTLFLGEPLCWLDAVIVAGVAVMLAGLAEPGGSGGVAGGDPSSHVSARQRWICLVIVFASNGAIMLGFKLFGVLLPGHSSASLVTAIYGSGAVMALSAQACSGKVGISRREFGLGLGGGGAMGLSALAMLAAMQLPAAAAFPVIQGTSLAGGVLACALVFRERLTQRKLAALTVGLGSMVLTAWR